MRYFSVRTADLFFSEQTGLLKDIAVHEGVVVQRDMHSVIEEVWGVLGDMEDGNGRGKGRTWTDTMSPPE